MHRSFIDQLSSPILNKTNGSHPILEIKRHHAPSPSKLCDTRRDTPAADCTQSILKNNNANQNFRSCAGKPLTKARAHTTSAYNYIHYQQYPLPSPPRWGGEPGQDTHSLSRLRRDTTTPRLRALTFRNFPKSARGCRSFGAPSALSRRGACGGDARGSFSN